MNAETKKKLCFLYKRMSLREVSEVTEGKISYETVRRVVKEAGVLREQERKYVDHDKAKKVFMKHGSYQKAAEELGISRSYMFQIVNDSGKARKRVRQKRK